jgi:hypothetical protein
MKKCGLDESSPYDKSSPYNKSSPYIYIQLFHPTPIALSNSASDMT